MGALVANARMYAVTPEVEGLWRALFRALGEAAKLDLIYVPHPAPKPLDALWERQDLGLVFMCGWPFANLYPGMRPVAAPLPRADWADGRPVYRTDLVVADGFPERTLANGRIGWTAEHSQSGYRAVIEHLPGSPSGRRPDRWVGPLVTPRRVVTALLAGEIDVGPLDAYWHDLLKAYEPGTAVRLRTIESTVARPMPLLVASERVPNEAIERLRRALGDAGSSAATRPLMDRLRLGGFAPIARADYDVLIASDAPPTPSARDS